MQESVDLARGLVAFYRFELAEAAAALGGDGHDAGLRRIEELREPYAEAIKLERDVAKAAIDAGIAERRTRLAERQAEMLAGAIADGLQEAFGDLATAARRTVFAGVVRRRLLVLESQEEPPVVDGRGRSLPVAA